LTDANLSGVDLSQANLTGTKWTEGLDISPTFLAELRDDPSIDFWNTSFSELAKAGVPLTVEGIRRWGGGLSSIDITAAIDLGLPDAAAALPYRSVLLGGWIEAGFTLEEALEWQEHILTPERAADWRDCGLTPQEADDWQSHRIYMPNDAKPWIDVGLGAFDAAQWRASGVDPATAARRIAAGLAPPPPSDD